MRRRADRTNDRGAIEGDKSSLRIGVPVDEVVMAPPVRTERGLRGTLSKPRATRTARGSSLGSAVATSVDLPPVSCLGRASSAARRAAAGGVVDIAGEPAAPAT
jgi:hypothetical protein